MSQFVSLGNPVAECWPIQV